MHGEMPHRIYAKRSRGVHSQPRAPSSRTSFLVLSVLSSFFRSTLKLIHFSLQKLLCSIRLFSASATCTSSHAELYHDLDLKFDQSALLPLLLFDEICLNSLLLSINPEASHGELMAKLSQQASLMLSKDKRRDETEFCKCYARGI